MRDLTKLDNFKAGFKTIPDGMTLERITKAETDALADCVVKRRAREAATTHAMLQSTAAAISTARILCCLYVKRCTYKTEIT